MYRFSSTLFGLVSLLPSFFFLDPVSHFQVDLFRLPLPLFDFHPSCHGSPLFIRILGPGRLRSAGQWRCVPFSLSLARHRLTLAPTAPLVSRQIGDVQCNVARLQTVTGLAATTKSVQKLTTAAGRSVVDGVISMSHLTKINAVMRLPLLLLPRLRQV